MKVKLLNDTKDTLNLLYVAARTCYNDGSPIDMFESIDKWDDETKLKLIIRCIKSNHLSVLEHINFNFAIEGISRACSHQLVRHRHCSFSQQSQRYCDFSKVGTYVTPIALEGNHIFLKTLKDIQLAYEVLTATGIKPEDARAILPNACCTNLVMTCNLRELIHICNERLCAKAQSEIRGLIKAIKKEVVEQLPFLEPYLQPKCERLGYCSESVSCGRKDKK